MAVKGRVVLATRYRRDDIFHSEALKLPLRRMGDGKGCCNEIDGGGEALP